MVSSLWRMMMMMEWNIRIGTRGINLGSGTRGAKQCGVTNKGKDDEDVSLRV